MLIRLIAALLLVAAVATNPARAQEIAALSEQDQADVARVEDFINRIDTLKAKFFQFTSTGEYAEGQFFIKRPGKMRIEYDPPVPVLIVADGLFLIYNDTELGQVSRAPLLASPASVLLREAVDLHGDDLTVTEVERSAGALRIAVNQTADPLAGKIMLTFSDQPLALRKWTVIDAQGTVTDFSLVDPRYGVSLDPSLFVFIDEIGGEGKDR